MSAYVIADFTPKEESSLKQYSAAVGPLVEKYNGKFVTRGVIELLSGSDKHHEKKAIIEFPDHATAMEWYSCDEYQALIPLRDKGMAAEFHLI